jgi:hypothetical protein
MVGSVDRLMALKPVNFAWKVDGSRVDGFLAHEAQAVVPEAVSGTKDEAKTVDVKDEDGNVIGTEERPVYQGIDQSKLVPCSPLHCRKHCKRLMHLKPASLHWRQTNGWIHWHKGIGCQQRRRTQEGV